MNDDSDRVLTCLDMLPSPDIMWHGLLPLTLVCCAEDQWHTYVRLLCRAAGASVNLRDGYGSLPLELACKKGMPSNTRGLLLDAGAYVNQPTYRHLLMLTL